MSNAKQTIETGKAVLGIEFGSTRIKAVLVNETGEPIASGAHDWENRLEDGIWTYSLDDIWTGLTDCYGRLAEDVKEKYDTVITSLAAIGFSGMMHGYMAFDKDGELLVPFRTWRNTITGEAAAALTNSTALEHRTFISGDLKRGRTCRKHFVFYNLSRIHSLETDRRESTWCRRGIRYVPDRRKDKRLQSDNDR